MANYEDRVRDVGGGIRVVKLNTHESGQKPITKEICFGDLWVGDRFALSNGSIWTKLSSTTARNHCNHELSLKEDSYGYIGASICSFEKLDKVLFIPANRM